MSDYRRLVVYDNEVQLEVRGVALVRGDTFEVIRGNGPQEGTHMGTATVIRFQKGGPVLSVVFDDIGKDVYTSTAFTAGGSSRPFFAILSRPAPSTPGVSSWRTLTGRGSTAPGPGEHPGRDVFEPAS